MSIIFTLIARDDVILAEYSESRGNFSDIARKFLNKLKKNAQMLIDYN